MAQVPEKQLHNQILLGDALDGFRQLPDCSVNLVVTSPPYADNRKEPYSGVPIDQYVEWFAPYTSSPKSLK